MTQTQSTKTSIVAWIGPIAAFVLLIGGGWFLVWFWHGVDTSGTVMLSPETTAALMSGTPGAVPPAAVIPPLDIPDKGSIIQLGVGNSWDVNAGPFRMRVDQGASPSSYQLSFSVHRNEVFHGDDLKLAALAVQLMFNPPVQRQSGITPEVVQHLRDTFGRNLNNPELKVADPDVQNLSNLWAKYMSAGAGPNQQDAGAKLLDGLLAVGPKALAENQGQFNDMIKSLHQIIPADMEKTYRDNIRKATHPGA
jgi:hypothetical protein